MFFAVYNTSDDLSKDFVILKPKINIICSSITKFT